MSTKYKLMKEAGSILRDAFSLIFYELGPGVELESIDRIVGKFLSHNKAISGLKLVGFPYNMSASIDYEVVQGYPNRVINSDSIISIDMSILYRGVYVDKAVTLTMPMANRLKQELSTTVNSIIPTVTSLIDANIRITDIGSLIEQTIKDTSFRSCNYFHGHGIGDYLHEEPMIPNFSNGNTDFLKAGQFITIEPIIYAGPMRRLFFDHKWTIKSDELSAHAEDTVYVTNEGIEVLT